MSRKGTECHKGCSWSDTAIGHNQHQQEPAIKSNVENNAHLELPSVPPTPRPCSLCQQDSNAEVSSTFRPQLQMVVCEKEEEEAATSQQHLDLERSMQEHEAMLTLLSHYVQTHLLQQKILSRLYKLAGNVASELPKQSTADSNVENSEELLSCIANKTTTALVKPNELARLQAEYKTKRENFLIASHNFHILLHDQNVSKKQLQKLQDQYNTIVFSCQLSRSLLQQEMNRLIQSHKNLLSKCFLDLNKSLEMSQHWNNMAYITSFLSKALFCTSQSTGKGDEVSRNNRSLCLLPIEGDGDY